MAIEVKEDLIQSSRVTITKDGPAVVRVFYVSGLEEIAATYRLYYATQLGNIPQYGDPHPTIPNMLVQQVEADPSEGGVSCIVRVNYLPPAAKNQPPQLGEKPRLECGTSLITTKTQKGYGPSGKETPLTLKPQRSTNLPYQTASVDKSVPLGVVRFTRREASDPRANQKNYVGKINKYKIGLYDVHELLCSAITGTTEDGGKTYVVTYEFQYNPDTWDITIVYVIDGNPISVPSAPQGTLANFTIYQEADFSKLGLTLN